MNRAATLVTFFGGLNILTIGQPTFQKYYEPGVESYGNDLYELTSGNIMAGMASLSGTSIMDPSGNILHSHCFAIEPFWILQSISKINDNEYVFNGGYGTEINVDINPVIGRMDSLGNILSVSYYDLSSSSGNAASAGDILITTDDGIIVTSRPPDGEIFILKIDNIGDVIWARHFGFSGSIQFINELSGGDLLVGLNMDPGGAVVGRMDPNGNFLWLRSYIRPEGVMRDCVVESDGSFTVIGYTDKHNGPGTKLFMLRLNAIGDVQWCKGYDGPSGWIAKRAKLKKTNDDNYVVLAGYGKAFLMKTDMNGDTLWTRAAGIDGNYYEVYNLLAYSDGGFLFNGQVWDLGTFLFKTDSLGHLPCPEHIDQYPVQVQDLFPTDSSFTLTSVDGAIRYPITINDTIYPPVIVTDGCLVTSAPGLDQIRKFRIRPNPNTGQFTMEFTDPLLRESYYSVYDPLGKLLFQRPLPVGATLEEVDLSRFGKGTYVIKITDPEGIRHERVVLE